MKDNIEDLEKKVKIARELLKEAKRDLFMAKTELREGMRFKNTRRGKESLIGEMFGPVWECSAWSWKIKKVKKNGELYADAIHFYASEWDVENPIESQAS